MRRLSWFALILACNQGAVDASGSTSADASTGSSATAAPTTSVGETSGGAASSEGGEASSSTGAIDATTSTGGAASSSGGPIDDMDGDGVPDGADNCVDVANADQTDTDGDEAGDACDEDDDGDTVPDEEDGCPLAPDPDQGDLDEDGEGDACDEDDDADGIPDDADVFPEDGEAPGSIVVTNMYAHSASTLASVDVASYAVTTIGDFGWPRMSDQMTDLAIDRHGQLFGVSFGRLYVCHPVTVECWDLGGLPASYNGLTWIPAGTLLPDRDALIGIGEEGQWFHLTVADGVVSAELLGSYGAKYTSAGDAFSIATVGTFAAVYKQGVDTTVIVEVDPVTGEVLADLAVLPLSTVWGLAGWQGAIVAFDFTGAMAKVDPMTKEITPLGQAPSEWWGAAVSTVLPQ